MLGPEKLDGWLQGAQHTSHSDSGPGSGEELRSPQGALELVRSTGGQVHAYGRQPSHLHHGVILPPKLKTARTKGHPLRCVVHVTAQYPARLYSTSDSLLIRLVGTSEVSGSHCHHLPLNLKLGQRTTLGWELKD